MARVLSGQYSPRMSARVPEQLSGAPSSPTRSRLAPQMPRSAMNVSSTPVPSIMTMKSWSFRNDQFSSSKLRKFLFVSIGRTYGAGELSSSAVRQFGSSAARQIHLPFGSWWGSVPKRSNAGAPCASDPNGPALGQGAGDAGRVYLRVHGISGNESERANAPHTQCRARPARPGGGWLGLVLAAMRCRPGGNGGRCHVPQPRQADQLVGGTAHHGGRAVLHGFLAGEFDPGQTARKTAGRSRALNREFETGWSRRKTSQT